MERRDVLIALPVVASEILNLKAPPTVDAKEIQERGIPKMIGTIAITNEAGLAHVFISTVDGEVMANETLRDGESFDAKVHYTLKG